jgi:hypothetical protein
MDDLDVDPTIIEAVTVATAAAKADVAEAMEPAEIPGVNARDEDWERGRQWVRSCLTDPEQLYLESRLRERTFHALVRWLKAQGLSAGRIVSAEEKLLVFLHIVSRGSGYRNAKYRSGHALSKISRYVSDQVLECSIVLAYRSSIFHEVLDLLVVLGDEVIVTPPAETLPAITNIPTRGPFANCVGALDGTHFPAHVSRQRQRPYRDRHGQITQNVLAAVDFRMRFTYLLVGWEGSAHDGRVIQDAVARGFKPPEGCYYLADAGYSNTPMWLTPYRGVRYHLQEIQRANRRPENKYELFNYRHSSLRNVVERTFGVFKRRWRIYDSAPEFDWDTQVKLVYALAAVHNFISISEDEDGDRDFEGLPPALNEAVEQAQRLRQEEVRETGQFSMDRHRDRIAEELWVAYQAYNAATF